MGYSGKRVISVDDLSNGDVSRLFFAARTYASCQDRQFARHAQAVLMTAFFEPSTRTRLSFEMAAHSLGVRVSSFNVASSSMLKGESEEETIANLAALGPDILVIRTASKLDRTWLAPKVSIINGGDGTNEHPSQALLDCFTLINRFQTDDLRGLRILIVGDIVHSRVAHSNIRLMTRLGAQVSTLAPDVFKMPSDHGHTSHFSSFAELDHDFDAVMCLRVQKERMIEGGLVSDHEFSEKFGLSLLRLEKLGKGCVVLHPGPMNLGVEIQPEVAAHPRSLIREQVANGVWVRAALIDYCLS